LTDQSSVSMELPNITSIKLFVGGIDPTLTESQLYNYFRKFGVLTEFVPPKSTKRRKMKFNYVTYLRHEDTQSVLNQANHNINGFSIQVEPALSTTEIFNEQLRKLNSKLFVSGNLIGTADPQTISQELSIFANVRKVKKIRTDIKSFNSCFVTMQSIADAEYLLEQKSLVLPTLQRVTFRRYVPRGGVSAEVTAENKRLAKARQKSPYRLVCESLKEFHQDTPCASQVDTTITIRAGLMIVKAPSNLCTFRNSALHTTVVFKEDRKLLLIENKNQSILDLEEPIRFNISYKRPLSSYKGIILHQE
jgi:RNA recognition motif-containing protein